MVGIQALLAHQYRGYGPGITNVEPLMRQWAKAEASSGHVVVGEESRLHRGKGLGATGGAVVSRSGHTFARVSLTTDESHLEGGVVKMDTDDGHGVVEGTDMGESVVAGAAATTTDSVKMELKSEGEIQGEGTGTGTGESVLAKAMDVEGEGAKDALGRVTDGTAEVKPDLAPGTTMADTKKESKPLVVLSTGLADDRAERLLSMVESIKGGGYKGPKILSVPDPSRSDPTGSASSSTKPSKTAKPTSPKAAGSNGGGVGGGGAPERRGSATGTQVVLKKGEKRPRSEHVASRTTAQAPALVDAAPVKKKTTSSTAPSVSSAASASAGVGTGTRSPVDAARALLDRLTAAQASGDMAALLRALEKVEKLVVSMEMLKEVPLGKAISKIAKKIADPECKTLAGNIKAKWTSTLAS